MDKVLEKREYVLTLIINKSRNMEREYDSINPGEPPTHFTELIQRRIQHIKIKSPGNTKDIGIEKIFVLQVNCARLRISLVKKLIFERSITENAITTAATIWYPNWTFAGKFKTSSSTDPIMRIERAIVIADITGSNLKNNGIAIKRGIVTANPPKAGVSFSCIAFWGLSNSLFFLLVPGL